MKKCWSNRAASNAVGKNWYDLNVVENEGEKMKKIIFVLSYALFALTVYAYNEKTENQDLKYLLNGQYVKKMAEASQKIEELDTAVKKTLLFTEGNGLTQSKDEIWRLSSDIKTAVAGLPLDRGFSNTWMNYLGRLGNFAKESQQVEDEGEYVEVMSQASSNLRAMADEWQVATKEFMQGDLSIKKWQSQLDSVDATHDWQKMTDTVKQYTESDFPLTASESDHLKKRELQLLTDEEITKDDALDIFSTLFPEVTSSLVVEKSQPGAPYPFYHIRFAYNRSIGYIDITEKGGHILSYLVEKPLTEGSVAYEQLEENAKVFLEKAGYQDVELDETRENDTAWHFVFVRVEPRYGAKVFADTIHLKVAKDTGVIVGLDAMEYIQEENLQAQPMQEVNWDQFFQKEVTVMEEQLAYVENDRLHQRLAYDLIVTQKIAEELITYRVIVDTETLEVIKTEKQF